MALTLPFVSPYFPVAFDVQPTTAIFACGDSRITFAVDQFASEVLDLRPGQFIRLPELGGLVCMASPPRTPYATGVFKERLIFCFKHCPSLTRVIFINHEDCVGYADLISAYGDGIKGVSTTVEELQKRNLSAATIFARRIAREYHREIETEEYYIHLDRNLNSCFFEKMK